MSACRNLSVIAHNLENMFPDTSRFPESCGSIRTNDLKYVQVTREVDLFLELPQILY